MRSKNHSPLSSSILQSFKDLPPAHQRACFMVLNALINHTEPIWKDLPGEAREAWKMVWENYQTTEGRVA